MLVKQAPGGPLAAQISAVFAGWFLAAADPNIPPNWRRPSGPRRPNCQRACDHADATIKALPIKVYHATEWFRIKAI